uniref:(northern house mosquito) hypothetical protein n=1 Tax=Culex pipiens TaxID=7175 RepID=A0A8D8AX71_CULPI
MSNKQKKSATRQNSVAKFHKTTPKQTTQKKNKTEQNWGVCNTPSMNANEGTTNEKLHKVKATPHTLTHHHTQFADRLSPTFNYLCAKAVQCVCLCKTEINKCTLNQKHTHTRTCQK